MIIIFFFKEKNWSMPICKKSVKRVCVFAYVLPLRSTYRMKVMGFMLSHLPQELSFLTIYPTHLRKSWSVKEMRSLTCQFFNLSNSWKVDFPFVLCF